VTLSIAVVCEARADQQTGCGLADRVFLEKAHWLEMEFLPYVRQWQGLDSGRSYLTWSEASKLARARRIKSHGFFDGKPAVHDAHAARKALLLLEESGNGPGAVILLRDEDGDKDRRRGLEQARGRSRFKERIVIGLAEPMRECWVLAGFVPRDDSEKQRLATIESQLGFDPAREANRLTDNKPHGAKSPKRVLAELTAEDWNRQAECWETTDLAILRERGQTTGMKTYLNEIEERIVPLLRRDSQAD